MTSYVSKFPKLSVKFPLEKCIDFGFFGHIKKVEGQNCDFGRNKVITMFEFELM